MFHLIRGRMGRGKTLALTALAYRAHLRGEKVYSNYKLNFPYTPIKSLEDLENVKDGFVAIDEGWSWLDSRSSGTKKNKLLSAILIKSRKRGWNLLITAQHEKQIDARARRVLDGIICPQLNNLRFPTACKLSFFDIWGEPTRKPAIFQCAPIFKLYNTREETEDIKGFEIDEIKAKLKEARILKAAKKEGVL